MKLILNTGKKFIPLFLLVIFGFICLMIFFNTDQITEKARTILIQVLEDQLDEKVEIGGVTLFPLNRVTLHEVRIWSGDKTLAQADRIVVSFYLHDLIKGVEGLVRGIKEIQLVNLQVSLIKDTEGYGYEKFVKSQQKGSTEIKMVMTPIIRIIDGKVIYQDEKVSENIHNLNGKIELDESGINVKLKTQIEGLDDAHIAVEGSVTPGMNLEIDFNDLPLEFLDRYGISIPEVNELAGITDGSIKVEIKEDGSFDYLGNLTLTRGKISLTNPELEIDQLEGAITFNKDYAMIQNLEGETSAGKITLKGQVSDFSDPGLSLTLNTVGLQLAPIIQSVSESELALTPAYENFKPFEKVDGLLKGGAEVVGKLNNLTIKANLSLPELTYNGMKFEDISISGGFQNSLLTLREFNVRVDKGSFNIFSGYFDFTNLDKISYSMTVDIKNLEMSKILPLFGMKEIPSGKVNSRFYLSGEGFRHDMITAIGSAELLDGQYQQIPLDRVMASFWLSAGDLGLSKLMVTTPYLVTELSGNIDIDGEMDLTVEPSFINPGWFGEKFNLPVQGEGNLKGRVGGSISNPFFEGEVLLSEGSLWNQQYNSMSGGITINKQALTLLKTSVVKGDNQFDISGKVGFANRELDLLVNISEAFLEDLKKSLDFMDIPFGVAGKVKGKINLKGPWSDLQVMGDLIAANGVVADQPFNSANLSFVWEDNDIVFENFEVSYHNTLLQASGKVDDYETLDIALKGQNFDLSDIHQIGEYLPQIKGNANFRGELTGKLSSPSFWGTISSDSIRYNNIPIEQMSALMSYANGILKIKPMKVMNAGSDYSVIGEIRFDEKTIELKIQNKNSQVSDLFRYIGFPVKKMGYTLGGEILVKGALSRPFFELGITLEDGKEGVLELAGVYDLDEGMNLQLVGTNFDLSPSKDYLGLKSFNYTLNGVAALKGKFEELLAEMKVTFSDPEGGKLLVEGLYGINAGIDLTLKSDRFDIDQLKTLIPIQGDYTGKLNLAGTLKGQPATLNANLQIDVQEGRFNDYPIRTLAGVVELDKGATVNLDQKLVMADGNVLTVVGSVPITDPEQTLNLRVEMTRGNLAILPMLLPDVEEAGGQGNAHFELSGTLARPLIEGEIVIDSGFIKYTGLDSMDDINGKILLGKDRIILNNLETKYGKGKVLLTGRIVLDGLMPDELLLTARVTDFHFAHGSVDAMGDGSVSIRGKLMQPEVRGKLTVHDSTIKVLPTFDWPVSGEASQFAPTFFLELYPGENVRVIGENPLNMNVTIFKSDEEPLIIDTTGKELIITGDLSARSGTFNIYNSNFRISRASASFVEFNKYIPIINISAHTTIDNYRIFVDLNGLPTDSTNFNWKLTSDPPLSQEQITALLAGQGGLGEFLGGSTDVTAMITDEIWRYINQGLRSEFLNKLEETVEKALKLDSFYLDPVLFGDTKINVQIGKYLDDNLYVVYKRTFSQNPEQSIGFEFEISSNISLEGVYEDEGEYQLSLKADFPF